MPAFVVNDPTDGPVVIAPLSEWQIAGRFLHVPAPSDRVPDRPLRMIGYRCRGEAERLAQYVNDQLMARAALARVTRSGPHPDRLRWRSAP